MKFTIPLLSVISLFLFSCEKEVCRECYAIEQYQNVYNEYPLGTKCGDEITTTENQEYYPLVGTMHNECRE